MIKFLLQAILVVLCLLILIPMVMLLVGEGALASRIFDFDLPKVQGRTEIVEPRGNSTAYSEEESSVRIESMKLEHNVQDEDGNYGMRIGVEASASNLKGEIVHLLIRFYDKDGTPLKYTGTDEKYLAVDGTMSLQSKFGVTGESVHLNCSVIVPYNEFNVTKSGTTQFLVDACYYLQQGDDFSLLAKSNVCAFHLTL